jgi:alcohol dehydrogenase class IV
MHSFPEFSLLPLPAIHFGAGRFSLLPALARSFGSRILVVTGKHALMQSGRFPPLVSAMKKAGMEFFHLIVEHEPSPVMIDEAVSCYRDRKIDVVAAIGGGSVLDAGKAVSAMLPDGGPVERHIEGQEHFVQHDGRKVPFIAVPTTSGTGSEVTSNAVISRIGRNGYKRSLRHAAFVPELALIDPELMLSVSPSLTASSGMDTCTQLLEAYLSPFSCYYTDTLCLSGLERFGSSFLSACTGKGGEVGVRSDLAYASLMSGIALANAGLGIVHGFASSVGGMFDIPHGVLCATLLAEATRENISNLQRIDQHHPALMKYAMACEVLSGMTAADVRSGCENLLLKLREWQDLLGFPRLGSYGVRAEHLDAIVAITRSKSNPVQLDEGSMKRILLARL